eukprot:726270-Rhodomonas_salina.1
MASFPTLATRFAQNGKEEGCNTHAHKRTKTQPDDSPSTIKQTQKHVSISPAKGVQNGSALRKEPAAVQLALFTEVCVRRQEGTLA